jgi:hypothetical protein
MSKIFLAITFVASGVAMLVLEMTLPSGVGQCVAYHGSGMLIGAGGTMAIWAICDHLTLPARHLPEGK